MSCKKRMNVYFHIDELARDAIVASALNRELKARGGRVIYGNRFITALILHSFRDAFDAIILPSLRHYMEVFQDPDQLPSNVFILQTEAIGQATGTLRRMHGKYFGDDPKACEPWHKSVTSYLLWGYAHLNPFREYFPGYLEKCRVVGHPRLSSLCERTIKRAPSKKQVVGFVSRFNWLSPHDNRTPFESVISTMKFGKQAFPIFENSPDKDVEDIVYTEIIDFRVMLQVMMSLDLNRFAIHVRPHPRENRQGWLRLARQLNIEIIVSPWQEPFGHWLQELDFVVTPPSTSLYDIFFHGKSPIVINNIVRSREYHILAESDDKNQILEGTCRPESVAELVRIVESGEVPFKKEVIDLRLREQIAADIAGNSTRNIVDAIAEFCRPNDQSQSNMRKGMLLRLFLITSLFLSHLRWFKGKAIGRMEQGASFDMTIQRTMWINRLTSGK